MRYILIIVDFIILILAILWVYSNPSYGPLITCFVAVAGLIGLTIDNQKRKDKDKKIASLSYEILENYNVAKSAKPWTTYSSRNRILIEELKKILGEHLHNQVRELYLKLETSNTQVNNVRPGMWGNGKSHSYYTKVSPTFEMIIGELKKNRRFKRHFE